jgi:hypothetical protein
MEVLMRRPLIDDVVKLMQDIPELSLIRGEVGVVRSTWFAPSVAYEVEFRNADRGYQTRALLREEQVQVEEGAVLPFGYEEPSLMAGPVAG